MRRAYVVVILAAIVIGAVVGRAFRRHADTSPRPVALVEPAWPLSQALDEAAGYLARNNGDDGRFVYLMASDGRPVPQYNAVRHAGAIYALADYQVEGPSVDVRAKAAAAADRAAEYLGSHYVRPVKDHPEMLALWSDPKEEGDRRPTAKLGGAALAMVGLLGRVRAADAGAADVTSIQKLARFVLFLQQPSGEFLQTYTDDGGRAPGKTLYFPGEAILGLAMLYEIDRDPQWLDAALRGVSFLVASLRGQTTLPNDHWLMIAIDRLMPLVADSKSPPLSRDEMIEQSLALGRTMLEEQTRTRAARPDLDGCFVENGATTPSATRLEGLLALEHTLGNANAPAHAADRLEVRKAIVRGITFLRRAQVTSGPTRGGIPTSVASTARDAVRLAADAGEDSSHRDEVRIDFVQHALSAMMRYTRMCTSDPSGCEL